MLETSQPEALLGSVLAAVEDGDGYRAEFDKIQVPIYTTDADGWITYWNQACVDFAGREPKLGSDRWCVTWELYTMTGERLPHAECPMAEAVKEKRAVYGKVAIALRPDGTRKAFSPYPTPLFDDDGNFAGAVNILIDVSQEQAAELSDQAARCRRLAKALTDSSAAGILTEMASRYSETAASLDGRPT